MDRCSICRTLIQPNAETTTCPECEQRYHSVCWDELQGCATYGCSQAAIAEKAAMDRPVGQGWGDFKDCPVCGASIHASLLICSCGASFPYAEAMTREQYTSWYENRMKAWGCRRTLVILFVLSLLGLPAPLLGTIAGVKAYRNRELLAGTDGTYLAMGYGAAVLALMYTVVLALLYVGL